MVQWYEKAREMWVEAGQLKNEALMNLAEDFFDSLMVVHENSNEGKRQVGEAFLHHTGQLTGDTRVHITIQQEAARKLNQILDEIPQELKKQMLMSEEDLGVM
ncbi:synaptonemal complex protein 2-like [Amia ocellicauda]|uniref:synaptonemal complex protein 2-like n=1 Tax=Amia ocellicauda TaxID=2972642 RepID=UPI003463F91F